MQKHDYTSCINGLYFIENDIIWGANGSLRVVIGNSLILNSSPYSSAYIYKYIYFIYFFDEIYVKHFQ